MEKRSLFEGEEDTSSAFNINKDFAKRFEHNKRRELLDRGREKFGALIDGESESSESEEDDEGELINAAVEKKFLETIAMIRDNDPKLKKVQGELFKDSDFEQDSASDKGKEGKKLTYKDQIRSDVLKRAAGGASSDSEEEEGGLFTRKRQGETMAEEEARLKSEFKKRAESDESENEDFLKRKQESEASEPEDLERLKPDEVLVKAQRKAKKELKMETDTDLLKRFYGDESKLDQTDKFLRNYILL